MNRTIKIAPVIKTVVVEASPARAFEVFTRGIDAWWPRKHTIGATPVVESIIEPFVGGRWYTRHEDGTDLVVGHVRAWEPGQRFAVSWEISADWKSEPRAEFASEVEVRFATEGTGHTRVELEHRDFERMGEAGGEKMRAGVDGGWAPILEVYVSYLAQGAKS